MTSKIERLLTLVIVLAALSTSALPANAQLAIDRTELSLRPDAADGRTGVMILRNDGKSRAQGVIKVEDWDRAVDGTNRFYPAGTQAGSCAKSLKVFPLAVSLAPGESQSVRVDLDPAEASRQRSECWSLVLVETEEPVRAADGRNLVYKLRTGMKVYATPAGLRLDGDVTDVTVTPAESAASTPRVTVAFRNSGERHLKAEARIEVRRDDNTIVATVPMRTIYALPGSTMQASVAMPRIPQGTYTLLAIVDFGGPEIAAAQIDYEVP